MNHRAQRMYTTRIHAHLLIRIQMPTTEKAYCTITYYFVPAGVAAGAVTRNNPLKHAVKQRCK